jgi:hypothetical protein
MPCIFQRALISRVLERFKSLQLRNLGSTHCSGIIKTSNALFLLLLLAKHRGKLANPEVYIEQSGLISRKKFSNPNENDLFGV